MVTAKLIDIDGDLYIYEYRPEDGENVGLFGVTSDCKHVLEIEPAKDDELYHYRTHAITAIWKLYQERGELPPKIVMQW